MPGRYLVRPFHPSDLRRVLAIERAGFGEWAWDRNLFAEYARSCGGGFLVALEGDKVIGYCIACVSRGAASVESIAVAPAVQGRGAADALLRAALKCLRNQGITRVTLMVKVTNERALAFYEKSGFRKLRRVPRYYEDGADGVLMRLVV